MTPGRTPTWRRCRRRPRRRDRPPKFPRPETLAATPIEGLDLRRTVSAFGAAGRPRSAPATMLINLLRAADWDAAVA